VANIVLIHGIANEQFSADSLEVEWLPALAGGVRTAGFGAIADRLWRQGPVAGGPDVRMAFYGDLFVAPGAQGDHEIESVDPQLEEQLAREWLERAATRSDSVPDREVAAAELQYLKGAPDEQGLRSAARSSINGLARVGLFARFGMAFSERFVVKALRQVTAYFSSDQVRETALARVESLIDADTRVVIGHSLGSCIAFEAAHRLKQPLPLLITVGSPLGLRTIVYERLRPQPPSYPSQVGHWVNVADRNDVVAAEPDLFRMFGGTLPEGARFNGSWTADNGAEPHRATFYLTKPLVGAAVAEVMGEKSAHA
jgi:hypothetical protein